VTSNPYAAKVHRGEGDALFKIENINGNLNENAKTLTLTPYTSMYYFCNELNHTAKRKH